MWYQSLTTRWLQTSGKSGQLNKKGGVSNLGFGIHGPTKERNNKPEIDICIMWPRFWWRWRSRKYHGLRVRESILRLLLPFPMTDRTDISLLRHVEEDATEWANLAEKLALQTQAVAQHNTKFQQIAGLAPCGIQTGKLETKPLFTACNDVYFQQSFDKSLLQPIRNANAPTLISQ
jgi:hypothetical protein